jgi:GNAT superfamily N-acetyltransferase
VRGQSWRAAYEHIFGRNRLATISEADDSARWERWLGDVPPRAGAFVATAGEEVVGFASYGPSRDDPAVGELFTIYVLPSRWGAGLGQALMRKTLARLHVNGFEEAILWVLEDNPRTRLFYERCGWSADEATKQEEWLGVVVREVRYRIALDEAG